MFDFIRNHQRLMQILLLLLILPTFAFFGVQGLSKYEGGQGVASVDGQQIQQSDVDTLMHQQMDRMQQMLGPNFDPKMFDTPQAREQALNTVISQRVLQTQMVKDRLSVSNDRVAEEVRNIPAIQRLYKPDGTLDVQAYDGLLASVGITRDQLYAQTRNQIMMQEMTQTIPQSVLLPKGTVERLGALLNQQRQVAMLSFPVADYTSKVALPADAAKKYYDTHAAEFETPETLSAQYVVLDQAALAAHTEVTPAEIDAFYKAPANQARFNVPEQRRASHILVAVGKDASAADKEKAKAKAQDVLAKVRAKPADFAALAKQYSDDPGSAEHGGDLDWAPAANYVKPFSDALFALKDNQISDLVETEFGYHIIQLTGVRPGTMRPLEQAKPEIEAEIRKQKSAAAYAQASEDFSNVIYDQADSLQPVADKYGLKLQSADDISRTPVKDRTGPMNDSRVIDALFSADVLKAKHNTAAVEVSPGSLVAARVTGDHPSAQQPFEQVQAGIVSKLTAEAAAKLAQDAGKAKLAALQKAPDAAGFSEAQPLVRTAPGKLSADAIKAIFAADASKLPAVVGVDGTDGSFTVYRIDSVSAGAANKNAVDQLGQQLASQAGELEFSAYLEGLKKRLKVKFEAPVAATDPNPSSSAD